jgi:amino acid transporter
MFNKILIALAILAPFIIFYISSVVIKKTDGKWPIIKLSLASLFLLTCVLLFYRFSSDAPAGKQYFPPKLENGKVIKPKVQ